MIDPKLIFSGPHYFHHVRIGAAILERPNEGD